MDPVVSHEERAHAFKFCRLHLTGAWQEVPLDEVRICKVSGGMTNLIYYCALPDQHQTRQHATEPREVLLRLYGPAHSDTRVQLEIFNQLADENLGPKLLGAFESGRIEEYLPSNALDWPTMTSSEVAAVIARKIAAIHRLDVKCLDKGQNWLLDMLTDLYKFIAGVTSKGQPPPFSEQTLDSTRSIARELLSIDFEAELNLMTGLINQFDNPMVFSHNDLHQNNIILLHDRERQMTLDERIVLIDFEYASYNHRTFDIANHLSEWCFNYSSDEYPFFEASLDWLPSEQMQKCFLGHYVRHLCDSNKSKNNGTTISLDLRNDATETGLIESLYDEMLPFMMASNLLWAVWAIRMAYTSKIHFGYWEMAQMKFRVYEHFKSHFERRQRQRLTSDNLDRNGDDNSTNSNHDNNFQLQSKM